MKKNLMFLVMMLVSGILMAGCAGIKNESVRLDIEPDEQTISFVDTIELDKEKIYDRSLSWATQTYNSSKRVIDLKDREAGIISIHAVDAYPMSIVGTTYKYSLQIRMKENKTKMTFTIDGMNTEFGGYPSKNSIKLIHAEFKNLHASYASAIKNATKADDF